MTVTGAICGYGVCLKRSEVRALAHAMSEEAGELADRYEQDADFYSMCEVVGAALGLSHQVAPHDMARDEFVAVFGIVKSLAPSNWREGPFSGCEIQEPLITVEERAHVDSVVEASVLPNLVFEAGRSIGFWSVAPPLKASCFVWPNDCNCCS